MTEEHWYKEAIIYELHVKSFYDSSGNGLGDFRGLTQKLDYLQDLGITAVWLLPFYPSPLKDDGYDIADYTDVHPNYGSLNDFKNFLREAHRRGIRVITELVLNHTSDQHPWFQRARREEKGSALRDYYMWSDTQDKFSEARIIFQDFETSNWAWDPVAKSYYWHRFYSHQPDLNYDNPEVRKEIFRIIAFWLKLGVDGLRLDAVPYLFKKEGTNCENLAETHQFLKNLRAYVDDNFPHRMLLAEANQWPEDASSYFGDGDECHMAFHFPVMPRLFMAIIQEDALPIIEIMGQTPDIPDLCQWALFLRNHDELTLEMVTDEERDYMFRVYAHYPQMRLNLGIRRRLAPLLRNDRRKMELMNSLLFSLIGTPVLYYGDEIGMGDNIYLGDRNGVRTPMQWNSDKNAGFSKTNPQQLFLPPIIDPEYHYETINVESEQSNPHSLLWWTKQLIALRKNYKAFSYGSTEFLALENRKILAFFRSYGDEVIFIVANLSRFAQFAEINLSKYSGYGVREMFSGEKFPNIGDLPYFLTFGPYGYYWFLLEKLPKESLLELFDKQREKQFQELSIKKNGERIFDLKFRKMLENILRRYLFRRLWFKSLASIFDRAEIVDYFALNVEGSPTHVMLVEVSLRDGSIKVIPLYLKYYEGALAEKMLNDFPENVVIKFNRPKNGYHYDILYDASMDESVSEVYLGIIKEYKKIKTEKGDIKGIAVPRTYDPPRILSSGAETKEIYREMNSIIFPSEEGVLRIFWQIEEGMNVDIELRLFLLEKTEFRQFLPILGYIEYKGVEKAAIALAEEISAFRKEFNAKNLFIESSRRFLVSPIAKKEAVVEGIDPPKATFMQLLEVKVPEPVMEWMEGDLEVVKTLAITTANMHLALASDQIDPDFCIIPFTLFYQRSLYQNIKRKVVEAFNLLHKMKEDSPPVQDLIDLSLLQKRIFEHIQSLTTTKIHGLRMRYHGNYFLENLHYTGKDFIIANFEGSVYATYQEKRYKRSPFIDLITMYISFYEVSFEACELESESFHGPIVRENQYAWAANWSDWMGIVFFKTYFEKIGQAPFLPEKPEETDYLMELALIKKCCERILQNKAKVPVRLLKKWIPIYEHERQKDKIIL